ncbi:hypothetical protein EBI_27508 [Enterocytozoon bieneusi H348]|nr:hypothetical protein EBI_27508 [Enterocytozoon bieneusi H348]|eukprot:XP_002651860.1 hypothetical protein EBI_27508 [Enterocytozoon bieneusi H348]
MYHYIFLPIPTLHHQHTIIRHIHTTHTTKGSPQKASITPSFTTPIQTTENLSQKTPPKPPSFPQPPPRQHRAPQNLI